MEEENLSSDIFQVIRGQGMDLASCVGYIPTMTIEVLYVGIALRIERMQMMSAGGWSVDLQFRRFPEHRDFSSLEICLALHSTLYAVGLQKRCCTKGVAPARFEGESCNITVATRPRTYVILGWKNLQFNLPLLPGVLC